MTQAQAQEIVDYIHMLRAGTTIGLIALPIALVFMAVILYQEWKRGQKQ